jgi:hypothetical protein
MTEKVTASPELAVADNVIGARPKVTGDAGGVKLLIRH